jgi:hypothetical protein
MAVFEAIKRDIDREETFNGHYVALSMVRPDREDFSIFTAGPLPWWPVIFWRAGHESLAFRFVAVRSKDNQKCVGFFDFGAQVLLAPSEYLVMQSLRTTIGAQVRPISHR